MKTLTLTFLVTALAATHAWLPAAVLALPLAFLAGRRSAIRQTGVGMVRGGARRLRTGRLA